MQDTSLHWISLPDIPETWIILKVRPVPPERLQKTMGSMTRPSTSGLTSTGLFSTDSISVQRTKIGRAHV